MKIWKNKFLKQMIIAITLVFVIFNGIAPSQVYATKASDSTLFDILVEKPLGTIGTFLGVSTGISGESDWGIGNMFGNLLKELIYLVVSIGDVGMAVMQVTLLGDWHFWSNTMVSNKNDNLEDTNSWLYADKNDVDALKNGDTSGARGSMLVLASDAGLKNGIFQAHWKVPNMLYSPENIFANKIAALDANYINPHKYTPVNDSDESKREATSFAESISPTIASWYRAFRNIAIVGLLSVLVYIGIRILIGTVSEKAKYKERLTDWFVALCLVFFMHFIMAGIMMVAEKITDLFSNSINSGIIVAVDDGTIFRTSLTGYIRFAAQSDAWTEAAGYGIMYLILVGITLRFTFIYMKRALYLAFFTMISPLVAVTYPIDRAGDGKAQAFNMWIKEYFINAILQPMHLILYSALVGAAMTLVVQNPIYGIVALLFISTAEKWVKKMFKMDQAALTSTSLGDVAVLSSMLNMGKNIIGGIGKTAALVGLTVATGGAGGVVAGATAATEGAAAVGGAATEGTVAGGAVLGSGTVEEAVGASAVGEQVLPEVNHNDLQYYYDMKDTGYNDKELNQLAEDLQLKEYLKQKEAQEINSHTKDASTIAEKAPAPDIVGENIEDVSGKPKIPTRTSTGAETTTVKTGEASETEKKEDNSPASKYYKKEIQSKLIKKLTDKDPKDELIDMAIKGASGAGGALLGAPAGFFAAGLTGDNKSILAGTMGGATAVSGIADLAISTGNTVFNNNVKVLVKDGGLTDEGIIKNVAQTGQKEHWSEAKMIQIGKLAEFYPDLANDAKAQKEIKDILKAQGVAQKKLDEAIGDIIKAQTDVKDTSKKLDEKATKKYKNWE